MTSSATRTIESIAAMDGILSRLAARMKRLGLNFSVWDAEGSLVGGHHPGSGFCRVMSRNDGLCNNFSQKLAMKVIAEGSPDKEFLDCGCCFLGVPIFQRRRIVGAVVASYPIKEAFDAERIKNIAAKSGFDLDEITEMAGRSLRHSREQADDFLCILSWLLDGEQAVDINQQEMSELSVNLSQVYEELSLLYKISGSMRLTGPPEDFLQKVCIDLLEVMDISAAAVVMFSHPPTNDEDTLVLVGDLDLNVDQIKLLAATHVVPKTAKNCPMVDNEFCPAPESGLGRAVTNIIAAPLVADKDPIGILIGFNHMGGDFDSVNLKLITSIAEQAAVFMSNSMLYTDLQDLLMGVLHALTATIDAKDPYTCGHSQRVALLSKRIAELAGFSPERVHEIYLGGLLHDIGKIGVPESVLCKPGKLTDEEFELIKHHPTIGEKILGGIRHLDGQMPSILTHHERPDGKGYPQGLKGDQVPIEGLIVGLADCFDAMTSDRTYRQALPLSKAISEIRKYSGTQFDAELAEKFLALDLEELMAELREPVKTVFPVSVVEDPLT